MSKVIICARFRPLSSSEIKDHGTSVSIHRIDDDSFNFKDEKDGDLTFNFDKVFYDDSAQASVYEFLALPIVQDAINAINGTIITYGQTGAGKTYSMEGPGIETTDDMKKGLVPRVIEGIFEMINSSQEATTYSVKLSMVEIYMEKVRDLLDLSKDNIQIKENKSQGILLSGVTEIPVLEAADALQILSSGIANRAVGETQMNVASSRSHCIYILTVQQDLPSDKRTKMGKLILVDLAGSEKVGKTGAEGRLLEEAKTINKSLTALGKVVNALTCSSQNKLNHIPYRDSKLTRMLQDALGGSCRMALLCCCSPSSSNASETLSTLRFGARAQHIKAVPCVTTPEEKSNKSEPSVQEKDAACERILSKLRERMCAEDVDLLEELFIHEGIMFYPTSNEEIESDLDNVTAKVIASLQTTLEELISTVDELQKQNKALRAKLTVSENRSLWDMISGAFSFLGIQQAAH
ncbi:kinesin-like protein KIN-1 [Silene latifolia]|uniref:kinesin-like protein KIN-1 n=1 Tax=Silene latifolia TaxID=37657 RepID=UPI003D785EA6